MTAKNPVFEQRSNLGVLKASLNSPYKRKGVLNQDEIDPRSLYRSPTYRSSINLNHEETAAKSAYNTEQQRARTPSKYKPQDKIAMILNEVEKQEWYKSSEVGRGYTSNNNGKTKSIFD